MGLLWGKGLSMGLLGGNGLGTGWFWGCSRVCGWVWGCFGVIEGLVGWLQGMGLVLGLRGVGQ